MKRRSICSILAFVLLFSGSVFAALVHRYSFNGDPNDSAGSADGALMNGASISGGQVFCDGEDDFVDLPGAAIAINTYSAVTFELWSTQPATDQSYSMTASFGGTWGNGNGQDYLMISTTRGNQVSRAAIANTPDDDQPWNDEVGINGAELNDGLEHHYVLTADGTELAYYIDGILQDTALLGTTTLSGLSNDYGYLGKGLYTADDTVECSINEFRIYDAALSASLVQQHTAWGPDAVSAAQVEITETNGATVLYKSNPAMTDSYDIVLLQEPTADVYITISVPAGLSVGNGSGIQKIVTFTQSGWDQPQTVTVVIADLPSLGQTEWITHTAQSGDAQYDQIPVSDVLVTIQEDECGLWGYVETDYNLNCFVDLEDFAILGSVWLATDAPLNLQDLANDWLLNTFLYDETVYARSIQISEEPFFVDTTNIVNPIDEKVYGHFLEHIYHSANGGLWGELVWNRSFELDASSGGGIWTIEGDELVQSSLSTDVHLEFGDPAWTDYEITLEARKDGGNEAFLIVFRAPDSDNFYWCNIGGWGNTQHAIEKEVNGSRSRVTSYVTGSINTDQWYDIRIRCEGNRFQVWLDEDQIFDYTDSDSPYLAGMVGLGTWATQARYRNIQVTEYPDTEEVLFTGLPALPGNEFGSRFWTVFGSGDATMDTDALNDDLSVQIVATGGGTGLQQDDFKFIQQAYTGSLWMKGSLPDGVLVELLDGTTVLGQAALSAPTSTWTEYPFQITPAAGTDDGSLRITLQGAGTVHIDQVSLMGQDAIDVGGFRPDLLAAVEDLQPPVIRWPGGCFASLYLWKDGIGPQHTRRRYPAYMWDDQDTNSYGTDEFLRMCEAIGAEPLIVINTGILDSACGAPAQWKLDGDYVQYALDWMEYCNGGAATTYWGGIRAAKGHPAPYNVTYWEIDNETWAAGSAAYVAAVQAFAPAMRAKAAELDVPILLSAVGGGSYDHSWNEDVIDNCATLIDYISVHHYEGSGGYKTGPIAYEGFIIWLADYIANSDNPDMKIYNSEWNLQTTDWRTGLYAGGILNVYERQGADFKIGGPALFLRHTSASGWDNAFINFDHTGWFPAPNYVVMKLWREHYAPNRVQTTGTDTDLNVVSVTSAGGQTLYIRVVNPDPGGKSLAFEIDSSFVPGSAYMHYVAPGDLYARNTLTDPDAVRVEAKVVGIDGQVLRLLVPGYSAGVITVTAAAP